MRKIILALLIVFFTPNSQAQHRVQIKQNEAWNIVEKEVIGNRKDSVNVFMSNSIIKANHSVSTINKTGISTEYDSWFFFIDDMPFESWEHSCRYVFVNVNNGKYNIYNFQLPPLIKDMTPIIEQKKTRVKNQLFNISSLNQRVGNTINTSTNAHNYAIIISGGYDSYNNWERYWNHCSSIYQALVNIYGFSKDNIYVLMSDGTSPGLDRHMNDGTYQSSPLDLDGDCIGDVQYAATRSNIQSVFNSLSNILTAEDNLFVFTTDHGGQTSGEEVYLLLWNHEQLYDYEFASYINGIDANSINLCLVQCHSGGFIDNINKSGVVISTSCKYDESAYARNDYLYSEYIYHWISAIVGTTPDGVTVNADTNYDGIVSMSEAFAYANNHDTKPETPQYSSNPVQFGNFISLNNYSNHFFSISGPNMICPNSYGTYSIDNLPSTVTVSWSYFPFWAANLQITGNNCTVTGSTLQSQTGTLTATISMGGHVINTLTKDIVCHGSFTATYSQAASTGYDAVINE
ncbi:MAG: caspase family protein, partial [Lachnospiraceae bacterium]|nr:caspase family protein [Lachnospiraceae bacterium]